MERFRRRRAYLTFFTTFDKSALRLLSSVGRMSRAITTAFEGNTMATTAESTLVIGHRNPDMDAIASAIGYAWVLEQTTSEKHLAGRTGQVNAQTTFALEQ